MDQREEKQKQFASRIIAASRDWLVASCPYLARAIYELQEIQADGSGYASDGKAFVYDPAVVVPDFLEKRADIEYIFLHSVLHCLYLHPFLAKTRSEEVWDLACDIYIWRLMKLIRGEEKETEKEELRKEVLEELGNRVKIVSAQSIYRFFQHQGDDFCITGLRREELADLFHVDDHSLWYKPSQNTDEDQNSQGEENGSGRAKEKQTEQRKNQEEKVSRINKESTDDEEPQEDEGLQEDRESKEAQKNQESRKKDSDRQENKENQDSQENKENPEDQDSRGNRENQENQESQDDLGYADIMARWNEIADYAEAGLNMKLAEAAQKEYGESAIALIESLRNIEREQISYREFLQKFAVLEERMHIDEDSFDYIYYTYGLTLYKDTPLIEPLEYKEMQTIHEFVIAIDTSGSCDRELVKKFLTKTYDILSESIIWGNDLNIYIIQCDDLVRQETLIKNPEELETYMKEIQIYGRGGTDFRPVFNRIRSLRNEGKLPNLRGLLYFTDGYGIFPDTPTDYKTAFVFAECDGRVEVPPWAMKVYIENEGY